MAMHLPRLLVALLVIATWAHADETPRVKYGLQNARAADFLDPAQYHLSLTRVQPDRAHGHMGVFTFRHTLDRPMKLWGFGFKKDGSFRVRFEQFSRRENNRWDQVPVGYCGTGAETFELAPNREYILLIPLWPFAKSGDRGVVLLSGDYRLVSEEFDTALLRIGGASTHKPSK